MAFRGEKQPTPSAKTKFVRGTWPPSPEPLYAQQPKLKPAAAPKNTRDYGKAEQPGFGTTGMTGET